MTALALPVALEYTAPEQCPPRERFWQSVVQAAPELRRAASDEAARGYRVTVTASVGAFLGELRQAGKPEPRVLEAPDCAELVEALALMLVLSTEQEASDAVAPPQLASTTPPPPRLTSVTRPPPLPPFARRDSRPRGHRAERLGLGTKPTAALVGGLAWLGAGPDALLGITAGLGYWWGPVLGGRVEARAALGNNRADATYLGLAPQACVRLYGPTGELSACAGAAVGALQVKAVEYSGLESSEWLAPLLGVRAATWYDDAMFLELAAEAEYALIERAYHVKRDNTDFTTPPFSALATLALGTRF